MANNRMYLKCKECGEEFLISKMFNGWGGFWYVDDDEECSKYNLKNRLEDFEIFINQHQFCGSYENPFEISYENYEEAKENINE